MALRVISWPLGMVMLAKNTQKAFFWSELAWNTVSVGLTWFAVSRTGLVGAGYAFAATQVFHALMTYPIVRHLSGFRWSPVNRAVGTRFVLSIAAVMVAFICVPHGLAVGFGLLVTFVSGIYSFHGLLRVVAPDRLPSVIRRVVSWAGSLRVADR
jgi:PST family polysaccharide transporter